MILNDRPFSRRLLPLVGGFFIIGLLVFLFNRPGIGEKSQAKVTRNPSQTTPTRRNFAQDPSPQTVPGAAPSAQTNPKPASAIEKFVQMESLKVGHIDSDPDKSFQRLKGVARKLKRLDMQTLKTTALNQALNNDQRFLAVYLLSLAENMAALPALNEIALSPIHETDTSSRLYAEELVVRTQALQGLASIAEGRGLLADYQARQDNAFLSDQARRLLHEKRPKSP